ncbi:MAG: hypothetical protein DCE86_07440 [Flavobacteriaceae bacterium]|nr:hypothetical protein ASG38_00625 [Flavobacterium sp. Leaf359]PZO32488.1 MAG: hypothetical protein DCE86_07440 [Flavobacteriaceae bacterium]
MKPAIITVAGFVVFNRQQTEFIKMHRKFVALSVALYGWSCYLICYKKLRQYSSPLVHLDVFWIGMLFDERNRFLVEGKPL